jgi:hypothetical protein
LKTRKCNKSPYIEEEQTTQWPKEKVQKDKQRSTTHTHTTKADNDVRFILDQQAELDFYSSSSLKQQSTGRHVASL